MSHISFLKCFKNNNTNEKHKSKNLKSKIISLSVRPSTRLPAYLRKGI